MITAAETDGGAARRIEPANRVGGTWVVFGEDAYRVPAVSYAAFADLSSEIDGLREMTGLPSPSQFKTIELVIHRALLRAYPNLAFEVVQQMIDMGSLQPALMAALGQTAASASGLR